jgi:nicotinate-nucleotide adenylyltransferase
MRLGLFGGTFNPIHWGHLRVAEEVREAVGLDRVAFVVAADPPHKEGSHIVTVAHRLAMVRLAVEGNPVFAVSDFEATRTEKSYSLYTIRHFRQTLAASDELFFIIGADAFAEITTWHRWQEVLAEAHFVVMTRPGSKVTRPTDAMPSDFAVRYCPVGEGAYTMEGGHGLHFLPVTGLDIASSDLRQRVRNRRSIRYLTTAAVEQYIEGNRLYL